MLRAVIFDFDGVIVDSEMMHFEAFNKALQPFNVQISKEQYFEEYLGLTDRDLLKTLVEEGRLKINESQIKIIARKKTQIFEETAKQAPIIDGVREFLELLEQNDITAAICSGALSAEIETILNNANLRSFFEVIVSAEQAAKGKPAPDGFLVTLETLNEKAHESIKANECVVIEDSRWGLEAAKTAGMHTVAVTNSYNANELSLADIVVDSLLEFTVDDLRGLCK
jgi:HAD superfamily hydrolase (TIGR01509 family)